MIIIYWWILYTQYNRMNILKIYEKYFIIYFIKKNSNKKKLEKY